VAQERNEVTAGSPADDASSGEDSSRDTGEIRARIGRTRAEIGETVEAIQDRLKVANVVSRAKEGAKDAVATGVANLAHGAREAVTGMTRPTQWRQGARLRQRHPITSALVSMAASALVSRAWRRLRTRRIPRKYPEMSEARPQFKAARGGRYKTGLLAGVAVGLAGWALLASGRSAKLPSADRMRENLDR